MKVVAIVQARMGSSRFPGKVMKNLNSKPLIGVIFERLACCTRVDDIILATSSKPIEKPLVDYIESIGYSVFSGNEENVLDRFYNAAIQHKAEVIVRITGDCPL